MLHPKQLATILMHLNQNQLLKCSHTCDAFCDYTFRTSFAARRVCDFEKNANQRKFNLM